MKKIITISREFGAGGGELGQKLAERLGYELYNKEIILKAAADSNVDIYSLIQWDEKVPLNFGFTQSLFDFYNRPLSDQIFEAQKEVIRKIGEKGRCVIVGRNANTILKEYDNVLNVFIHADFNWRVRRMMTKMPDMTEEQVREHTKAVDKTRQKYCYYHTKTTFGAAEFYDITLSSSTFGIDKCADILEALAKE